MELNIIALLIPVLLFAIFKLLDKNIRTGLPNNLSFLKLLLALSVLILYVGNIGWLFSPFTKQIKVRVYDADTKKPISGAHVRVDWLYETGTAGGAQSSQYKSINLLTDSNGEFTVPSQLKPISFYAIPLIIGRYDSMRALVFQHNYWSRSEIFDHKVSEISLKPLKSEEDEFTKLKSLLNISKNVSAKSHKCRYLSDDEITFIEDDFARLEKKYPNSPLFEELMISMISTYNWCGNQAAVVEMEKKIVQKFPDGEYSCAITNKVYRGKK